MPTIRFPSLARAMTHGYLWDTSPDSWTFRGYSRVLSYHAQEYDTYGDSYVQHSGAVPVSIDNAGDYFASLATWLIAHPQDVAPLAELCNWPKSEFSESKFRFGMTVKCDENKRRYYSLSNEKVSAAESKAGHREWEPVAEWMKGTVKTALAIVRPRSYDLLQSYALANLYAEFASRNDHWVPDGTLADWIPNADRWTATHCAFSAVDRLVSAYRTREYAARALEAYHNELENDRQRAARAQEKASQPEQTATAS